MVIENRYEPAVASVAESAAPNMATSGEMIGLNAAFAAGYTGVGSRIAVIDTGIDTDYQSFDESAFQYSLQRKYSLDEINALGLLDAEEIAGVIDKLNIAPLLREKG